MKLKVALIALVSAAIIIKSCKKDDVIQSNQNQPTPYVIEKTLGMPPLALPVDNPLTNEGVLLGRMLFYDPIVSLDSSIACVNCHRQDKAFTDGMRFGKGIRGQILGRNSMPLFNLMWQKKFFWDGRAKTLREQVLIPIQAHNEMDMNLYDLSVKLTSNKRYSAAFQKAFPEQNISPETISKSLEQFLVTLVSFNAPIDQLHSNQDTLAVIGPEALRGLKLFMQPKENGGADCFHCHSNIPFFGNTSATGSMANNGLDLVFTDKGFGSVTGKDQDNGKFKTPSLRNVGVTAPYMHDGRFATLEEVLDFYSSGIQLNSPNLDINILVHGAQLNLTEQQKSDIVAFLQTLTDQNYLQNPAFKSPF